MAGMSVPDWRTSASGARVRVALWLHTEVRARGIFTKAKLREAFPRVEQVDRRMRELRPEGWVIATYREDRSLAPDELRLVQEGGAVWEAGYRPKADAAITDKERQAVFADDGYACVYCGITGGEAFADDPLRTAKLAVGRVEPPGGGPAQLVTACDRCHVAVDTEPPAPGQLRAEADALSDVQRQRLREWVRQGVRTPSPEELVWGRYRRSASEVRRALEGHLARGEQPVSAGSGGARRPYLPRGRRP